MLNFLKTKGTVVFVLDGPKGKRKYVTQNIITDAGDIYYAKLCAGENAGDALTSLYLGSNAAPNPLKANNFSHLTLIANTEKALTATFPKTNCQDADNGHGGVNVVTYKYEYGKADFNAAVISEGVLSEAGAAGDDAILCHFEFESAFEKTANDTLTVFVNHENEGV